VKANRIECVDGEEVAIDERSRSNRAGVGKEVSGQHHAFLLGKELIFLDDRSDAAICVLNEYTA
jgi:hypothetical protein